MRIDLKKVHQICFLKIEIENAWSRLQSCYNILRRCKQIVHAQQILNQLYVESSFTVFLVLLYKVSDQL
jgi:hypothetical protein